MKARSWLLTAALIAVLAPVGYGAEGIEGRFTVAAHVGTQSEVSGNIMQGTVGTLLSQPIIVDSARYRDVYGADWRYQFMLGYGTGAHSEIAASASYYKTPGAGVEAGRLSDKKLLAFFQPNDYEEIGLELGYRYYLSAQSRLKSYIGPIVGVHFIQQDILVAFAAQEAGTSIVNVPFAQKGAVPVVGMNIGFSFDFGTAFLPRHGHRASATSGRPTSSTTCSASRRSTTATAAGRPRSSW